MNTNTSRANTANHTTKNEKEQAIIGAIKSLPKSRYPRLDGVGVILGKMAHCFDRNVVKLPQRTVWTLPHHCVGNMPILAC